MFSKVNGSDYLPRVDFLSQEIEERWAVLALKVPHLDLFDPLFQG